MPKIPTQNFQQKCLVVPTKLFTFAPCKRKIASGETKVASKGNNFAPNKNIKLKENTSYGNNSRLHQANLR